MTSGAQNDPVGRAPRARRDLPSTEGRDISPPMLETKHSMLRRCRNWDYRQPCIYQITLVLADRRSNVLGRLVIDDPETFKAHIELSAAGEAVLNEWKRIAEHHPEVRPLFMQVMPDHVHFIIQVKREMAKPLGNVIGGFKTGSSKAAIGRPGLWANGFQDTILFHEGQLDAMFNYLRDNPRRLAIKKLMPGLFQVRRDLEVSLRLPPQAQNKPPQAQNKPPQAQNKPPQAQDKAPQAQNKPPQAQDKAQNQESSKALAGSVLGAACPVLGAACSVLEAAASSSAHFSAIGNDFLLKAPNIIQAQCSRADFAYKRVAKPGGGKKIARAGDGARIVEMATPAFKAKLAQFIAAAKHGAVIVSPCISDGEREIAHQIFKADGAVIALRNMGFSPLYKPGGKLFDRAANGKLLMLAPINWPYQTAEKPMTRFDACVLNRIAQLIAGPGAAEINYKGMKPKDIDRLVAEAVDRR